MTMMLRRLWALLALVVASVLAVAGCGGGAQQGDVGRVPETIRFAVPDQEGLEELQRNYGPFKEELSEVLGAEVEFFPVPDHTAVAAAMGADRVDVALAGPSEYVLLRDKTDAVPVVGFSRPDYYTVIASRENSGIETLQDLNGKKLTTFAPGGTTTHLGGCKVVQDAGMNCEEDVDLVFLGDYDPVVQALARGEADTVAMSHDRYLEMLEDVGLSEEEIPVVGRGEELPPDVFMANPNTLPEDFIGEMEDRMLRRDDALLDSIFAAGDTSPASNYEGSDLVRVKDSDYEYMRDAYEAAGFDDLSKALEGV